jgi:DNA-binding IclR family transcriptional regulator
VSVLSTNNLKSGARIQVIDRATLLLDALSRYSKTAKLKVLSAETGLHPSTAHRILNSLIDNHFVERDNGGDYKLGRRFLQLNNRLHSDIDIRAVALPYMQKLRDKFDETINLTIREGDVVIYFEKVTSNRMMHVQQIVGSRAPLHITGIGKLILGMSGKDGIESYAQRTNLPAYTRNTFSSLPMLTEDCLMSIQRGYAFDNEEAEIGVGCISVLLYGESNNIVAGLSLSAPIGRRKDEWVVDIVEAGKDISAQLGHLPDL